MYLCANTKKWEAGAKKRQRVLAVNTSCTIKKHTHGYLIAIGWRGNVDKDDEEESEGTGLVQVYNNREHGRRRR